VVAVTPLTLRGGALLVSAPWQAVEQPACGSAFGGLTSLPPSSIWPAHADSPTRAQMQTIRMEGA
jgi:hypothetical protein